MLIVSEKLENSSICLHYLWSKMPIPIFKEELSEATKIPMNLITEMISNFKGANIVESKENSFFLSNEFSNISFYDLWKIIGEEFFVSSPSTNVISFKMEKKYEPIEILKLHLVHFLKGISLEKLFEECGVCTCKEHVISSLQQKLVII